MVGDEEARRQVEDVIPEVEDGHGSSGCGA